MAHRDLCSEHNVRKVIIVFFYKSGGQGGGGEEEMRLSVIRSKLLFSLQYCVR